MQGLQAGEGAVKEGGVLSAQHIQHQHSFHQALQGHRVVSEGQGAPAPAPCRLLTAFCRSESPFLKAPGTKKVDLSQNSPITRQPVSYNFEVRTMSCHVTRQGAGTSAHKVHTRWVDLGCQRRGARHTGKACPQTQGGSGFHSDLRPMAFLFKILFSISFRVNGCFFYMLYTCTICLLGV